MIIHPHNIAKGAERADVMYVERLGLLFLATALTAVLVSLTRRAALDIPIGAVVFLVAAFPVGVSTALIFCLVQLTHANKATAQVFVLGDVIWFAPHKFTAYDAWHLAAAARVFLAAYITAINTLSLTPRETLGNLKSATTGKARPGDAPLERSATTCLAAIHPPGPALTRIALDQLAAIGTGRRWQYGSAFFLFTTLKTAIVSVWADAARLAKSLFAANLTYNHWHNKAPSRCAGILLRECHTSAGAMDIIPHTSVLAFPKHIHYSTYFRFWQPFIALGGKNGC